jgi:cellulose biosynthesis protein BcsQ
VSRKRSPGKGSHVVIYDPNPDITVEEVYKKAREALEALAKK